MFGNIWCFMIQPSKLTFYGYLVFYDPTLKIVFLWLFSVFKGFQRPENLAVDASIVWKYLVFYDPTLTIAFLWHFFRFSRGLTGQPVSRLLFKLET